MNTKLSSFSELANILSVKSSLRANLMPLFTEHAHIKKNVEPPYKFNVGERKPCRQKNLQRNAYTR